MSAAVQDGALLHVSASQLKSFKSCRRMWWFEKVGKPELPARDQGHFAEGTEAHRQVEEYLIHGTYPTTKYIQHLVDHPDFPAREGCLAEEPEDKNLGLFMAGVPVVGQIDYQRKDGGTVHVYDWKTMKLWAYALKPAQLAVDDQLIIYAKYAFKDPGVSSVTVGHGQMLKSEPPPTKKPRKKPYPLARIAVSEPLVREHVDYLYGALELRVEAMKEVAKKTSHKDVPGNLDACSMYGGCKYLGICKGNEQESMDRFLEGL